MERRHAVHALLAALLVVSMVGIAGAVEPTPGQASGQDLAATIKQVKEIALQVWEMAVPWVQRMVEFVKTQGRDVFFVVYEKASLQGVKSVATEAGRIVFTFFTGRPYQAAYMVAKEVPVVGKAVRDVVGEANLRKQAAREHAEGEKKEL